MKKIFNLLFFICIVHSSFATDFKYPSKTKKIVKEFNTTSDVTMNVTNSYGNITVLLWDQKKIEYTVDITVAANTDKKTTDLLNNITVDFEQSNNSVSATTVFKRSLSGNKQMEINYTIKIPKNAMANVSQKYGKVNINELNNTLKLTCAYGSLNLGKLNSKNNSFNLSYLSHSKADYINYATLDIRYSSIDIDVVNYIIAKGNYNTFKLNNAGTAHFETNYSKINTQKIQKIEIHGNYLNADLNQVDVSSVINSNYSTINQNIQKTTEYVQLSANYGTLNLKNTAQNAYVLHAAGNYFKLKTNYDLNYTLKSENGNQKEYKINNGNNQNLKIKVNGNYTTLNLQ